MRTNISKKLMSVDNLIQCKDIVNQISKEMELLWRRRRREILFIIKVVFHNNDMTEVKLYNI